MRVTVRAFPGSRRPGVGGRYGEAEPPVLIVRVSSVAADGRATEEVRRALAAAFGVPKRAVSLVTGATSRTKIFDLDEAADARLRELLAPPS